MLKFHYVKDEYFKNMGSASLPSRATTQSAGYDFYSPAFYTIGSGQSVMVWTDVKAEIDDGFVLKIYPKSGLATKRGLILKNTIGVVDADYYGNPSNDGNIGIMLWNTSDSIQEIQVGEKIAQGIFERYYTVDNDDADGTRVGGFGSTGK